MFKWTCVALAVASLSVLVWMANEVRQELRAVHQEILSLKPTLTLEGEADTLLPQGEPAQAITIYYNPRFAAPPQLTFPTGHVGWKLHQEQADAFFMQRIGTGPTPGGKLKWKAVGQPAKSNAEVLNEALLRELQNLVRESQSANRQQDTIAQTLQGLRQELRKLLESEAKK